MCVKTERIRVKIKEAVSKVDFNPPTPQGHSRQAKRG